MFITLCGNTSTSGIAEKIRNLMSYRGMACLTYDYFAPVFSMHDGAILSLHQWKDFAKFPFPLSVDEPPQPDLVGILSKWLQDKDLLGELATSWLRYLTNTWDKNKMLYVVLVYNIPDVKALKAFDSPYNIFVSGLQENCPFYVNFNDCAVSNIFDQVVDINKISVDEAADLIATSYFDKIRIMQHKDTDAPAETK